jgi:hypothetical protein
MTVVDPADIPCGIAKFKRELARLSSHAGFLGVKTFLLCA